MRVKVLMWDHLLSWQTKGIKSNGMQNIEALHPFVSRNDICGCVALCNGT